MRFISNADIIDFWIAHCLELSERLPSSLYVDCSAPRMKPHLPVPSPPSCAGLPPRLLTKSSHPSLPLSCSSPLLLLLPSKPPSPVLPGPDSGLDLGSGNTHISTSSGPTLNPGCMPGKNKALSWDVAGPQLSAPEPSSHRLLSQQLPAPKGKQLGPKPAGRS